MLLDSTQFRAEFSKLWAAPLNVFCKCETIPAFLISNNIWGHKVHSNKNTHPHCVAAWWPQNRFSWRSEHPGRSDLVHCPSYGWDLMRWDCKIKMQFNTVGLNTDKSLPNLHVYPQSFSVFPLSLVRVMWGRSLSQHALDGWQVKPSTHEQVKVPNSPELHVFALREEIETLFQLA